MNFGDEEFRSNLLISLFDNHKFSNFFIIPIPLIPSNAIASMVLNTNKFGYSDPLKLDRSPYSTLDPTIWPKDQNNLYLCYKEGFEILVVSFNLTSKFY
jgi:hypothetical protein